MDLNKKFTIHLSAFFKEELQEIVLYFKYTLKNPLLEKSFYTRIIDTITSLQYLPERYARIPNFKNKKRNLRRLLVDNYAIIYEVSPNTQQVYILHIFYNTQNYINLL